MATAVSVSVSQSSWSSCVDCSTLTPSMEKSTRSVNFTEREIRYFCRGKTFVATNICRNKHNFVATKQAYFCRDKHVFVATKHMFCHDKSMLVATKVLSRQTRISRDTHNFVAASILLSRHVTKMILVPVPAYNK